ncbi:MAG TPA: FG-GAP-like repeat-containing protein [Pyrinomonadaceae bacterium]|jgi:hypothetical protein
MRFLLRFALMISVAFVLSVAFSAQKTAYAQAEDDVVINEFSVNSTAGKEYVELLVTNASGVNMQGWTLSDVGTRIAATSGTEGDITLPASASYLANVPQGTHVVIVNTIGGANILPEDTSTADGNNKLVLIVGVTTGITTGGTLDIATAENLHLYAGTRAAGTLIDQVQAGGNSSYITGTTWGDNNGATQTDNINGTSSMPGNSVARFVPTANTLSGFQDNDTGARFVVDTNSYGTPGRRNAGVGSETAVGGPPPFFPVAQFDGNDRLADPSVWDSASTNWFWLSSFNSYAVQNHLDWGAAFLGDVSVPGDYDGDKVTDLAIYRPSEGNWYVIKSSDSTVVTTNWGNVTDIPAHADYDGDGKTDVAVFRPSEGNWYIINSATSTVTIKGWGASTDKLVPADYDGDGKADIAVYRPSEGNWYILNSLTNTMTLRQWGASTDTPVPSDYDGDGLYDVAVYRPSEGNWYVRKSAGGVVIKGWGASSDITVPADYDGDGKADFAVYRPSEGNWYIVQSSDGAVVVRYLSGAVPVPYAWITHEAGGPGPGGP